MPEQALVFQVVEVPWICRQWAQECGKLFSPGRIYLNKYSRYSYLLGSGVVQHCVTSRKVSGSIPGIARNFFRSMCPGVDSASKSEYQDNSGAKGGRCVRLTTYHLHVPIVKKSGGLNLLEPCGPVQGCNGTVFTFTFTHICQKLSRLQPEELSH